MNELMQKKYVEFQMIQQQMQQLQQQIQKFDAQLQELNNVVTALEDFKKLKKGAPMLVPLASGIFAYGELSDVDAVRVNVGSNVSVKKSVDDTIKLVHEQISEIEKYKGKMLENFTQMNQYVHMLQHELMKMVEEDKDKNKENNEEDSGCSCSECNKDDCEDH